MKKYYSRYRHNDPELHVVSREEMQPSDVNPRIRPNTPACAIGGAQPPFSTTGAAHPALHLRLLLLRVGDVEVNPGLSATDAPVPSALDPIHSTAPNASVSSMGTATA